MKNSGTAIVLLITSLFILSCSYIPFVNKKEEPISKEEPSAAASAKSETKVEKSNEVQEPKSGDIKVIDGVEYIYARNRKYMLTPYEPEYVWIRRDQYTPSFGESILGKGGLSASEKKAQTEMEKRIAKLEEELKKKGIAPQMAYPAQLGYNPAGLGGPGSVAFAYPSPRMKRRVIVLLAEDQTNFKNENLGDLATKRLISRLENTGTIICVDPNTTGIKDFTNARNMRTLNTLFGIQAILRTTLADVYTSTSKINDSDDREASFAMSRINIDVYDTDTGTALKKLSGRNPIFLTKEKGELSSEKAKIKAIDLAIEMIAEDLLKAVLSLDWHARIASIEEGRIFVNAGRLSGLETGKILEVYAPGEQIVDSGTKLPLGSTKGAYKGEIEVVELFGIDACWAKVKKGNGFSASDLVYVK